MNFSSVFVFFCVGFVFFIPINDFLTFFDTFRKSIDNNEVEEKVGIIKRQLNSDRREVQAFASATARKYSELLRVEIFHLVDQGVVDGELLSNAFTEYQSQYATEAMDEVYEKFSIIWDNLKAKLEELDENMARLSALITCQDQAAALSELYAAANNWINISR